MLLVCRAEPPRCVEQLMVRLAWLCVSSGCLGGAAGVSTESWLAQLLPCRVMVSSRVITAQPLRFPSRASAKRSSIFVPPTFYHIFPVCTLHLMRSWGNAPNHARMIPTFDGQFVDMIPLPRKILYAVSACGIQAMFYHDKMKWMAVGFMQHSLSSKRAACHMSLWHRNSYAGACLCHTGSSYL